MELLAALSSSDSLVYIAIFLSFLYLVKLFFTPRYKFPPSPSRLPILGNLHLLSKHPYRSFKALADKYGPLMTVYLGSTPTILISTAEVAQEITKNHDVAFSNRLRTTGTDAIFYIFYLGKDVAFASPGEYWKQMKKICVTEILSQKRVQEFQYVREEETEKLVQTLRLASRKGATVDLSDLFGRIANNIIARCALGRVFDDDNVAAKDSGGELVKQAIDLVSAISFRDAIPILGFLDYFTGFNGRLKKVTRELNQFLDEVIDEHRKTLDEGKTDYKNDIVYLLLRLQREGSVTVDITRENLKAFLMDMFLGGTDTSATTLEWTISQLIKNPSMMNRAQEEVRGVMGKRTKIEEADFNEMPYLRCLIKETLRYYLSPTIPRQTTVHVKVNGYDIPAKTNVLINSWTIHRDSKEWKNPDVYMPERFLDSSVDFRGQHFQFVPFGAGRRVCPGILFGVKEVEFILANLLFHFDFKLPKGASAEDLNMNEVSMNIRREFNLEVVPVLRSPRSI